MGRVNDLTGKTFERLTVVEFAGLSKYGQATWRCKCECGNEKVVMAHNLRSGGTFSCGCLRREKSTIHGLSKHPLYSVWSSMKGRCDNPNNSKYYRYGGRGIKVCERWSRRGTGFPAFLEDMGERPFPEASVERINRHGDYEPSNCKWGTQEEQFDNRDVVHSEGCEKTRSLIAEAKQANRRGDSAKVSSLLAELEAIFA